uniref:HAT C-terminal dimerisation domain-containing protein n=1 Tax=Mycena chlorophos TaxID=658473 RepID=A0ABQ0L582_MYCCL|nr:predicted protein [Mycena chlorophos]
MCMDNATNCDTLAVRLADVVPSFKGKKSRTRCTPHTVNLIAKAFISFFFKPSKKRRPDPKKTNESITEVLDMVDEEDDEENVQPEDEMAEDGEGDAVDAGKAAADEAEVKSVRAQAIKEAAEMFSLKPRAPATRRRPLEMTVAEELAAYGLFPKVAGFARRLHDTTIIQEAFAKLVASDNERRIAENAQKVEEAREKNQKLEEIEDDLEIVLEQKSALDRRVPTRWDSDMRCLSAHAHFENPIKQLCAVSRWKMAKYLLTPDQWSLAENMIPVLEIFESLTKLFSQAEVPLIHQVLPLMEALEHDLVRVRADEDLQPVIRIAAHASLIILGKYYALTDDCPAYSHAILMRADKKLQYFRKNPDWKDGDIEQMLQSAKEHWNEDYPDSEPIAPPKPTKKKAKKYASHVQDVVDLENSTPDPSEDTLDAYLNAPLVSAEEIKKAGGHCQYWEEEAKQRPRLAKFAIKYLSAPASSVDAERAFSNGRLQVNHLQHGMSSQIFKARVALHSWDGSPFFPPGTAEKILAARDKREKQAAKGKGKSD